MGSGLLIGAAFVLQFMVTFRRPLTPVRVASLEVDLQRGGGTVVSFLPDNSVLALLTPAALLTAEALPGGHHSLAMYWQPSRLHVK